MDTEENNNKSQFNAGLMRVQHLNELIVRATNAFQTGNPLAWFYILRSIKHIIISKLNIKERKQLKDQENQINDNSVCKKLILSKNFQNKSTQDLIRIMRYAEVEKYNEMLMDIMEEKDLLIPSKTDETTFA